MDLKTIQGELQQLSALVEGWVQADGVPALERDLALEKLRSIYDKVRFDAAGAVVENAVGEEAAAVAEVIDLGDVLSLDPFAGPEEPVSEPELVAEPEPVVEPEPIEEPAPAVESEPVAEPELVAEPEPVVEPESIAEPAPVVVSEPAPELVAEPEPVVEPEPIAEPAPAVASEPVAEPGLVAESAPAGPEPVAESVAEPVAEPVSVDPEPQPEPVEAAEPEAQPDKSHYVAPTLFGLEDETIRHRNKQRVIMSLYDTAAETPARPEPAPKPVAAPAETSAPAPVETPVPEPEAVVETPAAAPEKPAEMPEIRETPVVPQPAAEEDDNESGFEEITLESVAPAATVLGDVINHDVQTLADTLAAPRDRASELRRSEPVTDLRKAIGINDKFLLIRDLFGGDGEAYEQAIGTLNDCADFDDCMIYIAENYAWNPNSDGVKLLMELLERKFA